jgi:hypothetical protein
MRVRPCEGGPYDGLHAKAARKAVAYIDERGRAWNEPGIGRVLYRNGGRRWRFMGGNAYRCHGCGAFVGQRADGSMSPTCPLCGRAHT